MAVVPEGAEVDLVKQVVVVEQGKVEQGKVEREESAEAQHREKHEHQDRVQAEQFNQRLLDNFDMTWEQMRDRVLLRSQAVARSYATPLYPPGASGSMRYFHLVANLTEVLRPKGWERCDQDNIPRLVHRGRKVALTVTSGDYLTGQPWSLQRKFPLSKYPKGEATRAAIDLNERLDEDLVLFDDEPSSKEIDLSEFETWVLMVYVCKRFIQSEVSCPKGMDSRGRMNQFAPRIRLESLPNDGIAIDPEVLDGAVEVAATAADSGIEISVDRR